MCFSGGGGPSSPSTKAGLVTPPELSDGARTSTGGRPALFSASRPLWAGPDAEEGRSEAGHQPAVGFSSSRQPCRHSAPHGHRSSHSHRPSHTVTGPVTRSQARSVTVTPRETQLK